MSPSRHVDTPKHTIVLNCDLYLWMGQQIANRGGRTQFCRGRAHLLELLMNRYRQTDSLTNEQILALAVYDGRRQIDLHHGSRLDGLDPNRHVAHFKFWISDPLAERLDKLIAALPNNQRPSSRSSMAALVILTIRDKLSVAPPLE